MKMKGFARLIALVIVMAMLFTLTITAANTADATVNFDGDKTVTVTVTHPDGAGKAVAVIVTDKDGKEMYWNEADTDAEGKVTFTFQMAEADTTGSYEVAVGGENITSLTTKENAYIYVNPTDAVSFLTAVSNKSAAELRTYLIGDTEPYAYTGEDYGVRCNATSDFGQLTGQDTVLGVMANTEYTKIGDFISKYNIAASIQTMNEKNEGENSFDAVETYAFTFGLDVSSESLFASLTKDGKAEAESKLTGFENLTDKDAVLRKFNEAVALALFNDMSNETKGNLVDYVAEMNKYVAAEDKIDLSDYDDLKTSYKKDVMDDMMKEDYADFAEVKDAFDKAVEKATEEMEADEEKYEAPSKGSVTGTITVTPPAPVTPDEPTPDAPKADLFDDLATVEWAKEAINALAEDGVINGLGDGKFGPNEVLTREQFVKILVNALGIKADGTVNFSDVTTGSWYYEFVAAAFNSGIVNGVTATEFGVGASLTREQLCTMVYRAIKATGIELTMVNDAAAFADDAMISDYAKEAVDYLYRAGIINGVGGGNFAPQAATTRAMGAKIIYGVLEGGVK